MFYFYKINILSLITRASFWPIKLVYLQSWTVSYAKGRTIVLWLYRVKSRKLSPCQGTWKFEIITIGASTSRLRVTTGCHQYFMIIHTSREVKDLWNFDLNLYSFTRPPLGFVCPCSPVGVWAGLPPWYRSRGGLFPQRSRGALRHQLQNLRRWTAGGRHDCQRWYDLLYNGS